MSNATLVSPLVNVEGLFFVVNLANRGLRVALSDLPINASAFGGLVLASNVFGKRHRACPLSARVSIAATVSLWCRNPIFDV